MLDLSKPWHECALVVLDFEATGRDPATAEPVEVAAVRFEEGRVVGRFASLLKPESAIPEEATSIHGITDAMVADAPKLEAVASEIAKLAVGAVPVAYNEPYDRTMLHRYVSGNDVPVFSASVPWVDVFVMAGSPQQDKYVSGRGRLKLAAVCKRHGVILPEAHRASGDAEATGMLFHAIMGDSKATMQQVLARCAKLRAEQDADHNAWKKRQRETERQVWRGYAQAALASTPDTSSAAMIADDMLKLESERYAK